MVLGIETTYSFASMFNSSLVEDDNTTNIELHPAGTALTCFNMLLEFPRNTKVIFPDRPFGVVKNMIKLNKLS